MAYQCRQPCLPPPIGVPQCTADSADPCAPTCGDPCNTSCAEPCSAATYQSTQPCLPPPICTPLREPESLCTNVPASVSTCDACEEFCPIPSVEVSSAPCESPTMLADADPCVPPCVSLCSSCECSGASQPPSGEAVGSYVVPGSIVSLKPSGHVTVKPGPEAEVGGCESVFLDTYIPHFT